jgi:hypothetical protein
MSANRVYTGKKGRSPKLKPLNKKITSPCYKEHPGLAGVLNQKPLTIKPYPMKIQNKYKQDK